MMSELYLTGCSPGEFMLRSNDYASLMLTIPSADRRPGFAPQTILTTLLTNFNFKDILQQSFEYHFFRSSNPPLSLD
jgi:hypothetical protein